MSSVQLSSTCILERTCGHCAGVRDGFAALSKAVSDRREEDSYSEGRMPKEAASDAKSRNEVFECHLGDPWLGAKPNLVNVWKIECRAN